MPTYLFISTWTPVSRLFFILRDKLLVCSDDDETFEHDPTVYSHLRDDSLYSLQPRQKGRMSKMDIRGRADCDIDNLKCLRCDTSYSCLKTLTNHMGNQHSDKKPFFPCIFCGNTYSQVSMHPLSTESRNQQISRLTPFCTTSHLLTVLVN